MKCTYCNDDSNTELLETLGDFETWECLTCGKTFDVDLKDNESTENNNCMENKHTKGPWTYRDFKESDDPVTQDNRFKIECKTDYPGVNGTVAMCGYKFNAQLIAAAPELLEACKYVVKWHRENDSGEGELYGLDFVTTCIGVIRKAEGGE